MDDPDLETRYIGVFYGKDNHQRSLLPQSVSSICHLVQVVGPRLNCRHVHLLCVSAPLHIFRPHCSKFTSDVTECYDSLGDAIVALEEQLLTGEDAFRDEQRRVLDQVAPGPEYAISSILTRSH